VIEDSLRENKWRLLFGFLGFGFKRNNMVIALDYVADYYGEK
jgi:hypothetical protein